MKQNLGNITLCRYFRTTRMKKSPIGIYACRALGNLYAQEFQKGIVDIVSEQSNMYVMSFVTNTKYSTFFDKLKKQYGKNRRDYGI